MAGGSLHSKIREPRGQSTGEAGALELAVGDRVRQAVQQAVRQLDEIGQFGDPIGEIVGPCPWTATMIALEDRDVITDEMWAVIEPLLPRRRPDGCITYSRPMDVLDWAVTGLRSVQAQMYSGWGSGAWGWRCPGFGGAGFHLVFGGEAWLITPAAAPQRLRAGDIVLAPWVPSTV